MIDLEEPLSDEEILELHEFLISDATPEEGMDIVAADGLLTSIAVGPEPPPPSLWLKAIWGDDSEPRFESSEQAKRVISLILRRFNMISSMLEEPAEVAPILWQREHEGIVHRIADDWCWGFLKGISLGPEAWEPLLDDSENRGMMWPIITLGSDEGWELLEADIDPEGAEQAALDALESSVIAICRYWRNRRRELEAALRQASIRPRSLRAGRNDPCPCGSGRKFKRCCASGGA